MRFFEKRISTIGSTWFMTYDENELPLSNLSLKDTDEKIFNSVCILYTDGIVWRRNPVINGVIAYIVTKDNYISINVFEDEKPKWMNPQNEKEAVYFQTRRVMTNYINELDNDIKKRLWYYFTIKDMYV